MAAQPTDVAAFVERTCTDAGTTVEVTNPDALHHIGVILAERATTPGPTPEVVAQQIPGTRPHRREEGERRERTAA